MSITSHSNTLLPTSPQLIPGMSLSVCIALNCFASRSAALDEAAAEFEAISSKVLPRVAGSGRVVGWLVGGSLVAETRCLSRGKPCVTEGARERSRDFQVRPRG